MINDVGIKSVISHINGKGINKVVFVSTCSNYGKIPEDITADENYELKPLSLYAKSKVAAEKIILGNSGKVDYTGTVLRFSTAFGLSGRMRFDLTVNDLDEKISKIFIDKRISVLSRGLKQDAKLKTTITNDDDVIIDEQLIGKLKGLKLNLEFTSSTLETDIKSLKKAARQGMAGELSNSCLLYTSDAADE